MCIHEYISIHIKKYLKTEQLSATPNPSPTNPFEILA